MSTEPRRRLDQFPVHLGLGATVVPLARFTGTADWYERYGAGCVADGAEGRLVTMHSFSEPWAVWEVHPHGDELVVCTAGELTLHQEVDGVVQTVVLAAGEAAVNPRGVWHTADVTGAATALFITAGLGTAHRPR